MFQSYYFRSVYMHGIFNCYITEKRVTSACLHNYYVNFNAKVGFQW